MPCLPPRGYAALCHGVQKGSLKASGRERRGFILPCSSSFQLPGPLNNLDLGSLFLHSLSAGAPFYFLPPPVNLAPFPSEWLPLPILLPGAMGIDLEPATSLLGTPSPPASSMPTQSLAVLAGGCWCEQVQAWACPLWLRWHHPPQLLCHSPQLQAGWTEFLQDFYSS